MILGAVAYASSQSPSSVVPRPPAQLRQIAYLKASNPAEDAHFGCGGTLTGHAGNASAISDDGNTIAVGAPHENSGAKGINGNQNDKSVYSSGAVYVFTRRGNTVAQQAYIKASNPGDGANFGSSVALSRDGNTHGGRRLLRVQRRDRDQRQPERSLDSGGRAPSTSSPARGTTWSQQAYIKASNTGNAAVGDGFAEGDQFGYSIALSADGNTLAVGAIGEDSTATGINGDQADNIGESVRRGLRLHAERQHLVAAGVRQVVDDAPERAVRLLDRAQRERRHARGRRVRRGPRQGRALRAHAQRRHLVAPGPHPGRRTRRTATRSGTRSPSATTATPSRRAPPTRTA